MNDFKIYDGRLPDPQEAEAPEIGDAYRFVPVTDLTAVNGRPWYNQFSKDGDLETRPVTGRAVYVNRKHRFARYAWDTPHGVAHECFKF